MDYLRKHFIGYSIHYPKPPYKQPAYKDLIYSRGEFPVTDKLSKEILSLPMNPYLKEQDLAYVCQVINQFIDNYL